MIKELLANTKAPSELKTVSAIVSYGLTRFDATTGNLIATLPSCLHFYGGIFIIQKIDATANIVTVTPSGADTIDGAASIILPSPNSMVILFAEYSSTYVPVWTVLNNSASSGMSITPEDLTIDAVTEDITPTCPGGYEAVVRVMGSGGAGIADTLKRVNINATAWKGKRLLIMRQPTAGTITIEKNIALIAAASNRTLDSDLDNAEYRITATDNLIAELCFSNNG
jgi:hypothetical protein